MTVVVTTLAIAVAVLGVLVVGLLRSHAAILRQLHQAADRPESDGLPLVSPHVPSPTSEATGRPATDLAGVAPDGSAVVLRVTDARHDTVLAFLSSTCLTCETFWDDFRDGVRLPPATRLVIVAKGAHEESPSALTSLAPQDVPVLMSSEAWEDYGVPGSPYVVHVEGRTGSVRGEGTGGSWEQVAKLLAQATGDLAFVDGDAPHAPKARTDAERERDTDGALLSAGISPGDPSLYQRFDGSEVHE